MSAGWLVFFVILGCLVCHEAGHGLAATLLGVKVREVLVGLGPRLLSGRVGGVAVSLRALPVGAGVDVDDESFAAAPLWKRVMLLLAGPLGNVAGCVVALALLGWVWMGRPGWWMVWFALGGTARVLGATVAVLAGGPGEVVGPVGLAKMVSEMGGAPGTGFLVFACVSAGLAVFNLLPVVPLDGGRLLLEFMGGRVSPAARRRAELCGAVLLGVLVVVVFLADLAKVLR